MGVLSTSNSRIFTAPFVGALVKLVNVPGGTLGGVDSDLAASQVWCSSNVLVVCGWPFSSTTKSAVVRLWTGLCLASVTTTSTTTTSGLAGAVGAVEAAGAVGAGSVAGGD